MALGLQVCGVVLAIQLEKQMQKSGNVVTSMEVQIIAYLYAAFVVFISIANAFLYTGTCYKIFNNFKQISNIFQQDLNHQLDYSKFSKAFNFFFAKIALVFIVSSTTTLIFVFCYNRSNIFFWACLVIFPNFCCQITFCQFIFFIRLVKQNLEGLKIILEKLLETERISKIQINNVHVKLASSKASRNAIDIVTGLRRIYGLLYETTALTHDFIGVAITASIVMAVLNNISASYKVYLLYKGEILLERAAGNVFVIKCI